MNSKNKDNPANFPQYDWLKNAKVFNQKYERVPTAWLKDNVDVLVLHFSLRGKDRRGIMHQFYEIYENAKYSNLPIEVINVPMDESKEDMMFGFEEQANWFTLMFNDPLIITLQYRYEICAVPHLCVLRTDGSIVSSHGILDLDRYGRNALITWFSNSTIADSPKRLSKEITMYGPTWKYLNTNIGKNDKPDYHRKFSVKLVDNMEKT